MKKKIIISVIVVFVILAVAIGITLSQATKKVDKLLLEEVCNVELSEIKDGEYLGSYDAGLVKVEVEVLIESDKIKEVKLLKHTNGKGDKGETVIDNIIENQSLQVDTIAGATISSKAIIKAVENALVK